MLGYIRITIDDSVRYVKIESYTDNGFVRRRPHIMGDFDQAELLHPDEAQHYMKAILPTIGKIEYVAELANY